VWISCSQHGPQGSQHLIRFSVGHFALVKDRTEVAGEIPNSSSW
jgi:hypothetical protein